MPEETIASPYFDTGKAAQYLNLSKRFLEVLRVKGGGPRFLKTSPGRGGSVRYHQADLESWAEARKVSCTSDEGQIS